MNVSHARLPRAMLLALLLAACFVTIKLVAQDVCGNPLACFEPGQEGEMWQALTPFGETNDPACTNSLHPNPGRIREDSRQCPRDGYAELMPPPLGQMLDPFALAADGERIYVSDQSNHRIQAFKFDGTPIPIAHPIGDGIAGFGPYPAYPADPSLTGTTEPVTGQRLYAPDGIAVDAEHKLIVGDYSGYLAAFNPDGTPAFGTMENPQRLQMQGLNGIATKASGIAISPGTIVRGFGVPTQPEDTGRIVVTDRLYCFVYIYDAGFNLLHRIPEQIPAEAYQGACVYDESGDSMFGVFDTPVAAAFDAQGRIYISEYGNNRIQVLDPNGVPLGGFGSAQFQYPWGVVVDQHGRVVVADTENQRIAFFNVDLSGSQPNASLVFELDAKGTLDGFPTAIVEQLGTAPGLDPAGRILVTDTLNNRIQRFQLPELAIINPRIDRDAQTGTFQVVVPPGKAASVNNVGVSAVGVNATVLTLNGVAPANTAPLDVTKTALENATEALGTDIAPSQIATYEFSFTAASDAQIAFIFNAAGNDGVTSAEPQEASLDAPCLTCVSTHTVFKKSAVPPASEPATATNGWYNQALTVRVDASTTHEQGLAAIAYQFVSGPESSGLRHGGSVHVVDAEGAASLSTEIDVLSEGASTFRYWAIGGDGTVESSHFVTLSLDSTPPDVSFHFLTQPNAAGWYNASHLPVTATFVHRDDRSGPVFTGTGNVSFTNAGRGQYVEESATDRAGNTRLDADGNPWPFRSDLTANGGFPVNIDTNAPALTSVPNDVVIEATGPDYGVLPPGSFDATATDPALIGDPRPGADLTGSGVAAINNPEAGHQFPMGETLWAFTATDAAGNISEAVTRKVTVIKKPSTVTSAPATIVYGTPLTMSATISPSWATGAVNFVIDGGAPIPVAIVSGGASLAMPLLAAGAHTLEINYGGSASVQSSSTTVAITVARRAITVAADSLSRNYGVADPPLTYHISNGAVVEGDAFSGNLTRAAGELPGTYAITQGTLALSTNYDLTFVPGTLTINSVAIGVFATNQTKIYGEPDNLAFTTDVPLPEGVFFTGSLSHSPAGETVGGYTITQGTLALPAGFNLHFHSGTLTIAPRPATVTADNQQKGVGQVDPPLTVSTTGFVAGDAITFSATRAAGETAGTYPITPAVAGAAIGNYNITLVPGVFTIVDNQPPVCSAATGGEIWPPNHNKFYAAPITGVTDPEGGPITIVVTGIWQDEPVDSTGDGKFSPDGQGIGTSTAWIRAERNGLGNKAAGNGRVYQILFTATDNKGATCDGSVLWTVPHDRGQRATAIDDGPRYDSTAVVAGARDKSQIHRKSPTP